MKEFAGKVAVITGGASGIGLAMARRLATEGMKIVVGDIEQAALDSTVAEMSKQGTEVIGVRTDVSKPESVQALADATLERFGAAHVVCNNAGVAAGGILWESPLEDWRWGLGVNMWGVIHGVRTFVPIMIAQGTEGHIVNTASILGLGVVPFSGIYTVSKHAVTALSETLLYDLAAVASPLKVSVLCPGWVRTALADSDRNRPSPAEREPGPMEQAFEDAARDFIASGMPPEEVAEHVFRAIRDERFWVLPHEKNKALVRARMQSILDGDNPVFEPELLAKMG